MFIEDILTTKMGQNATGKLTYLIKLIKIE